MPSTVVHVGFAALLVAGLLRGYYGPKALAVVLVVLVIPEADTAAGWFLDGAHRSLLHNLLLPAVAAIVLYWETNREESAIRRRWGAYGVWVAWVALFAHVFAHLFLDLAHLDGINPLYPLYDRFFSLDGEAYLSTTDGFVQTFLTIGEDPTTGDRIVDAGQGGTTADTHVSSPVDPSPADDPDAPIDRRAPIAVQGWQLFLVVAGAFTLIAKQLQSPLPSESDDER